MTDIPKRRGRPPNPAIQAQLPPKPEPVAQAAETGDELPKRRRRAKVGGLSMRLHAPEREGFKRRWANDDGNRIAELHELGYEPVSDSGIETHSPGSVASRLVGTSKGGSGLKAILMETPDELYAEGRAELEELHSQVDQAIVKGADFQGGIEERFQHPGRHGSIRVET